MEQRAETGKKIAVLVLGIFIILGIAACVFLMLLTRTEKLDQAAMATSGVVEEQSTENLLMDDWIEESLNSFQVDAPADVVAALTVQTQDTVQTPEAVEEEYLCTYSSERLMTEADVAELQAGVYENLPEGKNIIGLTAPAIHQLGQLLFPYSVPIVSQNAWAVNDDGTYVPGLFAGAPRHLRLPARSTPTLSVASFALKSSPLRI